MMVSGITIVAMLSKAVVCRVPMNRTHLLHTKISVVALPA